MLTVPTKLTDEVVSGLAADGRDRIVFDTVEAGFGVRLTPAGAKIFIAQARIGGKPRRVTVGAVTDLSVRQARAAARVILTDLKDGRDPVVEKAARARKAEATATTAADLADRWLKEHVRIRLKPRTVADYEKIVEQHIVPAIGRKAVAEVAKSDVVALHVRMAKTPRRANYVVACVRAMFTFAEDVGLRQQNDNPAKRIRLYRERASDRYLSNDEIALAADLITKAETSNRIGPHTAAGLRLALFTGARSGEVTAVEWSMVDLDSAVIRLPDSKANRPRTIHLNGPALEVLKNLPRVGRFVVAGLNEDESLKNLSRAWIQLRKNTPLADVRLHDLRHTFASVAAAQGMSLPMIGRLLGHTVAATTQRYAHLHQDAAAAAAEQVGGVFAAATAPKKGRAKKGAEVVDMKTRKRVR